MAQPRAHQVLVRGDAEHAREQPQEMERADSRPGRRPAPDRSPDANARRSTARFRPRGGDPWAPPARACARARTPPRRNGWPAACPTSSRPTSLRPSAAACASSPSTINSGSGGAAPTRQTSVRSPIASTSSGRQEERQAFVAADNARGCRCIRRRDGRPGSIPPPVRTTGRASGSRSCPCAHRRSNGSRYRSTNGLSSGPAVHRKSDTEINPRCSRGVLIMPQF